MSCTDRILGRSSFAYAFNFYLVIMLFVVFLEITVIDDFQAEKSMYYLIIVSKSNFSKS